MQTTGCSMLKIFYDEKKTLYWNLICNPGTRYVWIIERKQQQMQILLSNNFFFQTRHYVLQLDSSIKFSLFKKYLIATNNLRLLYTETRTNQVYIPRFRLSLQQLAIIETGWSDNCEQQNRKCFLCSYFVENKSYLNMSFKRSITLNH